MSEAKKKLTDSENNINANNIIGEANGDGVLDLDSNNVDDIIGKGIDKIISSNLSNSESSDDYDLLSNDEDKFDLENGEDEFMGDVELTKSKKFSSDFYIDDIMKELSESGFYSADVDGEDEKDPEDEVELSEIDFQDQLVQDESRLDYSNRSEANRSEMNNHFGNIEKKMDSVGLDLLKKMVTIEKSLANLITNFTVQKEDEKRVLAGIYKYQLLLKSDIDGSFDKLMNLFMNKLSNDSIKDNAFEKLYSQMEGYKKNFIRSAMYPLINDLILYYDRLVNNISHLKLEQKNLLDENKNDKIINEFSDLKDSFLHTLEMFKDELLEILSRYNIVKMDKSEVGQKFDPETSKVIKKTDTEDPALDMTIKEVLQEGFWNEDKVFRRELVIVYKAPKDNEIKQVAMETDKDKQVIIELEGDKPEEAITQSAPPSEEETFITEKLLNKENGSESQDNTEEESLMVAGSQED